MRGTLLLVGTDREYLNTLEERVRVCDIACSIFEWSTTELTRANACQFDALLVDLDAVSDPLPVLRSYRNAMGQGPFLACSRQFTAVDVVLAYGAGVDDYFAKSTDLVIVEAKLRRAVRRGQYHDIDNDYHVEHSTSPHRRLVRLLDAKLTRCEFRLLELLANAAGQLVLRSAILEHLWGRTNVEPSLLYEHVSTLRSKVRPMSWTITNVRGKGYRLECVRAEPGERGLDRGLQSQALCNISRLRDGNHDECRPLIESNEQGEELVVAAGSFGAS